jgi:hypothetical protein
MLSDDLETGSFGSGIEILKKRVKGVLFLLLGPNAAGRVVEGPSEGGSAESRWECERGLGGAEKEASESSDSTDWSGIGRDALIGCAAGVVVGCE